MHSVELGQPSRRAQRGLALAFITLTGQACGGSAFGLSPSEEGLDAAGASDSGAGGTSGGEAGTGDARPNDGRVNEAAPIDAPVADAAAPRDAASDAKVTDSGRDATRDAPGTDAKPDTSPPADAGRTDAVIVPPNECAIVSCGGSAADHSCCDDMYPFSLNAMQKPEPALTTSFSAGASSASAAFRFDAPNQAGAIGFSFRAPFVPASVRIAATWSGAVSRPHLTLEAPGAGCAYSFQANWEANLSDPLYCWGGAFAPDGASFRIESTVAGDARLSITSIEMR